MSRSTISTFQLFAAFPKLAGIEVLVIDLDKVRAKKRGDISIEIA